MIRNNLFVFDDSKLPNNDLTTQRTEEIEKLVMPRLEEAFKKLRSKKPHLFKNNPAK